MMAKVYLSYHEQDAPFFKDFLKHLAPAQRAGLIRVLHRRQVKPGEPLRATVEAQLEDADVIVLGMSADFIACEECWCFEYSVAVERHRAGRALLVPIIVRECDWEDAMRAQGFGLDLRPIPFSGTAILGEPERGGLKDAALRDAARQLIKLCAEAEGRATRSENSVVTRIHDLNNDIARIAAKAPRSRAAFAFMDIHAKLRYGGQARRTEDDDDGALGATAVIPSHEYPRLLAACRRLAELSDEREPEPQLTVTGSAIFGKPTSRRSAVDSLDVSPPPSSRRNAQMPLVEPLAPLVELVEEQEDAASPAFQLPDLVEAACARSAATETPINFSAPSTPTLPSGAVATVTAQKEWARKVVGWIDRNHRSVTSALAALVLLLSTYTALLRVTMAEGVIHLVARSGLAGHVRDLVPRVVGPRPSQAVAPVPREPTLEACVALLPAQDAAPAVQAPVKPATQPRERAAPLPSVPVSLPTASVGVAVAAEPHDGEPEPPDAATGGQGEPQPEGGASPKASVNQITFVQDEVPDGATPELTPEPSVAAGTAGTAGGGGGN